MTETLVTTALGAMQGVAEAGRVAFRGIPYAQARRFGPPEPVAPWAGVRDATAHGPIAPQAASRLRVAMGNPAPRPMAEDCLNLTVWTPGPGGARPVLVWMHGGAWLTGAGALDWYDGGVLAREGGMVVVAVTHRLGALGYARHPAIGSGNYGTQDLAAALAWVHEHIAAFGGDPAQVTVAGQSAGAGSIGRLILDPAVRPLFRRAILQSGGFGRTPLDNEAADAIGEAFLHQLGLDPADPGIQARVQALPVEAFVTGQSALARARSRFGNTSPPFMPSVATPMTEAALLDAIAAAAEGLELMIGTTLDESHAFFAHELSLTPDPAALEALFRSVGAPHQTEAWYRARRPGGTTMDLVADHGSNNTFVWPGMRLAVAAARRGVPVHAYSFGWAAPGNPFRACHCIELPFLFGTFQHWHDAPMLAGGDPGAMAALGAAMRRSWIAFIHGGSPAQPGLDWPHYTAAGRETMLIGETWRMAGNPAALED